MTHECWETSDIWIETSDKSRFVAELAVKRSVKPMGAPSRINRGFKREIPGTQMILCIFAKVSQKSFADKCRISKDDTNLKPSNIRPHFLRASGLHSSDVSSLCQISVPRFGIDFSQMMGPLIHPPLLGVIWLTSRDGCFAMEVLLKKRHFNAWHSTAINFTKFVHLMHLNDFLWKRKNKLSDTYWCLTYFSLWSDACASFNEYTYLSHIARKMWRRNYFTFMPRETFCWRANLRVYLTLDPCLSMNRFDIFYLKNKLQHRWSARDHLQSKLCQGTHRYREVKPLKRRVSENKWIQNIVVCTIYSSLTSNEAGLEVLLRRTNRPRKKPRTVCRHP